MQIFTNSAPAAIAAVMAGAATIMAITSCSQSTHPGGTAADWLQGLSALVAVIFSVTLAHSDSKNRARRDKEDARFSAYQFRRIVLTTATQADKLNEAAKKHKCNPLGNTDETLNLMVGLAGENGYIEHFAEKFSSFGSGLRGDCADAVTNALHWAEQTEEKLRPHLNSMDISVLQTDDVYRTLDECAHACLDASKAIERTINKPSHSAKI